MDNVKKSWWASYFKPFFVLILIICACSGISVVGVNFICISSATTWLPIYPGAQVVSDSHTFLSTFGMGETLLVLATPDAEPEVYSWYAVAIRKVSQQNNPPRIARTKWATAEGEDGNGTLITLYSACAV